MSDLVTQLKDRGWALDYAAAHEIERLLAEGAWRPIDENTPKDRIMLLYAHYAVELGHFNTMLDGWVTSWDHRRLHVVTHYKDICFPLPDEPASSRRDAEQPYSDSMMAEWHCELCEKYEGCECPGGPWNDIDAGVKFLLAENGELRKALIDSESRTIDLTEGMLKLIHESNKSASSRRENQLCVHGKCDDCEECYEIEERDSV